MRLPFRLLCNAATEPFGCGFYLDLPGFMAFLRVIKKF